MSIPPLDRDFDIRYLCSPRTYFDHTETTDEGTRLAVFKDPTDPSFIAKHGATSLEAFILPQFRAELTGKEKPTPLGRQVYYAAEALGVADVFERKGHYPTIGAAAAEGFLIMAASAFMTTLAIEAWNVHAGNKEFTCVSSPLPDRADVCVNAMGSLSVDLGEDKRLVMQPVPSVLKEPSACFARVVSRTNDGAYGSTRYKGQLQNLSETDLLDSYRAYRAMNGLDVPSVTELKETRLDYALFQQRTARAESLFQSKLGPALK